MVGGELGAPPDPTTIPAVNVILNGTPRTLEQVRTVSDLLRRIGKDAVPCAVEVNQALVSHRERDGHELHEGDRVEVVTLVGGG
jgi:sulfur carrier protein